MYEKKKKVLKDKIYEFVFVVLVFLYIIVLI